MHTHKMFVFSYRNVFKVVLLREVCELFGLQIARKDLKTDSLFFYQIQVEMNKETLYK